MNFIDVETDTVSVDVKSSKSVLTSAPSTLKFPHITQARAAQHDQAVSTHPIICIGLDKKTGRVKWCPDCQFIKFAVILPLILLPVTVIFVLMMRISNMYNGRIEILPTTERIKMPTELEPYHRLTRDVNELNHNCALYRHIAAESIDIHDKELFRDIRTSFIPSEICLQYDRHHMSGIDSVDQRINSVNSPTTNQSKSVVQLRHWINKYANQIDLNRLRNEHDLLSSFHRPRPHRRRRRNGSDFIESQINLNASISQSTKTENRSEFQKNDEQPFEIPALLRTFWKGGKTYEQIRNSQVDIMKKYMDFNVRPCDDFYGYACGNWERYCTNSGLITEH